MSILEFEYKLELKFSAPIKEHCFLLRCLPLNDPSQTGDGVKAVVYPHSSLWRGTSEPERGTLFGRVDFPHETFTVITRGRALRKTAEKSPEPHPVYTSFTPFTAPDARMREIAAEFMSEKTDPSLAERVMTKVHSLIEYTPDVTDSDTTASQALKLGKGVCQDYAHIYCGIMRTLGVPTRYIAGLGSVPGETHAWNECYIGGRWLGFDSTHNTAITDGYLKFTQGADANMCALNRGVFMPVDPRDRVTESQNVTASVTVTGL